MGLLKIIKKTKEREKEMRLLILGLDNAGKTTILKKFNGEDISQISPTLGFNIKTLSYNGYKLNCWGKKVYHFLNIIYLWQLQENKKEIKLKRIQRFGCKEQKQIQFLDVGGQQTIRSYWKNYFEQTDGLIWVVDSTDKARLDDCKKELQNLLKQEKLIGATLLIFCNKQDVPKSLSLQQIREYLELDLIQTRHWGIIACSAVTGDGLLEGIDWIVTDISSRIFMMS